MKKSKKHYVSQKLIWFGNDADGLSMIDILTIGMFLFFILVKIFHIVISIIYITNNPLIVQMNLVIGTIDKFMNIIVLSYFGKKTIDTSITKIGLLKNGEYKMPDIVTSAKDAIDEVLPDDVVDAVDNAVDVTTNTDTTEETTTSNTNDTTVSG